MDSSFIFLSFYDRIIFFPEQTHAQKKKKKNHLRPFFGPWNTPNLLGLLL